MPRSIRPPATPRTQAARSAKLTSIHSSPTLCLSAGRSPNFSPASSAMSAIVREPVLASAAVTVPTSISSSSARWANDQNWPAGQLPRVYARWSAEVEVRALWRGRIKPGKDAGRPQDARPRSTEDAARRRSGFRQGAVLGLLEGGQEQRLVDPTLEYRHPELHALGDNFPPLHPRLTRELGGGQMDRHERPSRRRCAYQDFIDRNRRRNHFFRNWAD